MPWASGTLAKDAPGLAPPVSDDALNRTRAVALHTEFGELRIRLRPEWHLPSVRYVQRVARQDVCTAKCQFYRAEPGFLLQGGPADASRTCQPRRSGARRRSWGRRTARRSSC